MTAKNFTKIYLTGVKILQKVLVRLLFRLTLYTYFTLQSVQSTDLSQCLLGLCLVDTQRRGSIVHWSRHHFHCVIPTMQSQ